MSTHDGPGLRYVVFMQGCPLQCAYCHNPDTWNRRGGKVVRVSQLTAQIDRLGDYYRRGKGGVTFSGGEPCMQARFVARAAQDLRRLGYHIALDTAGSIWGPKVCDLLDQVDLVLLDIKHPDPEHYRTISGGDWKTLQKVLGHLKEQRKATWIRHVCVPGRTRIEDMSLLAGMFSDCQWVERIELLAYHTMGVHKWEKLGREYPLKDVPPADPKWVGELADELEKHTTIPVIRPA